MRKDILAMIIVCIKNVTVLCIFAALAVVFDKWWIIFFAMLFTGGFKTEIPRHYLVCDSCGEKGPVGNSVEEARAKAKRDKWWSGVDPGGKHVDYCSKCASQYRWAKREE